MIPSTLGSSSYYSQYMRDHRRARASPEHVARDRLLTDRDAYLQHLEEQVRQVSAACMLADELKSSHNVLEEQVSDVERRMTMSVQGVQEAQALASVERRALERGVEDVRERLVPLELLPDKLVGLEVELDRTRSSQNKVMLEKMTDLEDRLSRMEQRHRGDLRLQQEQIARTTSHLQLVMENNERLEKRCKDLEEAQRRALAELEQASSTRQAGLEESLSRLRDVSLPKAVSELSMAQERAAVETSKDLTRMRHEVGMAENRMLAALAKQAALAQEQITQIQDLVSEALAPSHPPPSLLPYPAPSTAAAASAAPQPDAAMTPMAMEGEDPARLARKVQVLTAAFRHADDETRRALQACRDGMAGLRQALDTVQASVKTMAGQALECAARQTETVLHAVTALDTRVTAHEDQLARVGGRVSECWEALHEADTRIEILDSRVRLASPRRPAAKARAGGSAGHEDEDGQGAADSPQLSLPPPEFERVLELCVSMHQLAKRNAREIEQLRDRVDRTVGGTTTISSSNKSPRAGTASTPPGTVLEGSEAASPTAISPSRPLRPQMKVQVRKTPRAKEVDVPSTTSGSSSPSRPVRRSPSKPRAPSSGGEEGPELQQVMREVGDLFTAIEGRQVRVKRKASPAGTAHSSPSPRPRSGSGAKRPSPAVLQSGTFSSKTPRADTARAPLHQPRAMVATFPKPQAKSTTFSATHIASSSRGGTSPSKLLSKQTK